MAGVRTNATFYEDVRVPASMLVGRENGLVTIEHYTQLKSVYVELGDVACPY